MVKPKRPTLRGMDAFLTEEETPPASQQDSTPAGQLTSKTGSQQDSTPVLMKGTYYITPDHDMKLERIRLSRKQHGVKVDKSALIREAIDLLHE